MKTTAKRATVLNAVAKVNKEQGYYISLKRDEQRGKWYNFTLKAKSGFPGSRYSDTGRKLPSASWYAHGYVFEEIFKEEPNAIIWSLGEKLQAGFEWKDRNISSEILQSETSIL